MTGLHKREQEILKAFREDGEVTVSALSSRLNVSMVTVRADLKSLEEKGMLVRIRGGAIPAYHPELLDKMGSHREAKERIARKAAELIEDNDRIMITNGTTSALVGRYLREAQPAGGDQLPAAASLRAGEPPAFPHLRGRRVPAHRRRSGRSRGAAGA